MSDWISSFFDDDLEAVQLQPDLSVAINYLDHMGLSDTVLQTFDDSDEKRRSLARTLGRVPLENLVPYNQKGAGCFYTVNKCDESGRREAKNITRVNYLFADTDGAPHQPILETGLNPTALVETSEGKYHVLWKVSDCSLEQFGPLQKAISARFGTDNNVTDLPRVLRLPGFYHQKKGVAFQTRIVKLNDVAYTTEQLITGLGLVVGAFRENLPEGKATAAQMNSEFGVAPATHIDIAKLKAALEFINADSYDDWLRVGMCLFHSLGDVGLPIWIKWSQRSDRFVDGKCEEKWTGFDRELGPKLGIGTIFLLAREGGYNPEHLRIPAKVSDVQMAAYAAKMLSHLLRYVPEIGWFAWDGRRWVITPGSAMRLLRELCGNLIKEYIGLPESERSVERLKELSKLESHQKLSTVLEQMKSFPELMLQVNQLDSDKMKLNVLNGTIDLKTGVLSQHAPEDFITRLVSIEYAPTAKCPVFDQFISKVMGGNQNVVAYLQRFAGYSLTGMTNEQVLLFLYGTGSNGKTTFVNTVVELLGDYTSTADAGIVLHKNSASDLNIFATLAGLRGSRLVKLNEIADGDRLNEANVKNLTGQDEISCRFLHGGFFNYVPQFKVLMFGNYKPQIRGRDYGVWRRIHMVEFGVTFKDDERDTALPEKLKKELPGILNWAIAGCIAWCQESLKPPPEVVDSVNEYKASEDRLAQWIEECCDSGLHYRGGAADLRASFAKNTGWHNISSKRFGDLMREAGFEKEKSGSMSYIGLRIRV